MVGLRDGRVDPPHRIHKHQPSMVDVATASMGAILTTVAAGITPGLVTMLKVDMIEGDSWPRVFDEYRYRKGCLHFIHVDLESFGGRVVPENLTTRPPKVSRST